MAMLRNLEGIIHRRVLLNYRIDPDAAARHVPDHLELQLVDGFAVGGVCLIDVALTPPRVPSTFAFRSWNGAHRFAVLTPDGTPAVYIPRRHSNAWLTTIAGGRIFPGVHGRAHVAASDRDGRLAIVLDAVDGSVAVDVAVEESDKLPEDSVFADADAASRFFEAGCVGYSDRRRGDSLDAITLHTEQWSVSPAKVISASSTYFDDAEQFPAGSASIDHALVMREVAHSWSRAA